MHFFAFQISASVLSLLFIVSSWPLSVFSILSSVYPSLPRSPSVCARLHSAQIDGGCWLRRPRLNLSLPTAHVRIGAALQVWVVQDSEGQHSSHCCTTRVLL